MNRLTSRTLRRLRGVCSFILAILWAFSLNAQDSPVRKWRDNTGKYEVQARFLRMEGDKVWLRKADGSEINVRLDVLSAEDRQFVELQGKAGPKVSNRDAGSSPADWITFVTYRRGNVDNSLPGLVLPGTGSSSLVVAILPPDNIVVPTEDLTLTWNVTRERREVAAVHVARNKKAGWLLLAPADQLPPPLPVTTPEDVRPGMPVVIDGYQLEPGGEQIAFARVRIEGKIESVIKAPDGMIAGFKVQGADAANVSFAIISTPEGRPVACKLPAINLMIGNSGADILDAQPLEKLATLRDPQYQVRLAPVRYAGSEMEYEVIVQIDDPLRLLNNPRLLLKETSQPKYWTNELNPTAPLPDAIESKLTQGAPSALSSALDLLAAYQFAYNDHEGDPVFGAPTNIRYRFPVPRSPFTGERPIYPQIPGLELPEN